LVATNVEKTIMSLTKEDRHDPLDEILLEQGIEMLAPHRNIGRTARRKRLKKDSRRTRLVSENVLAANLVLPGGELREIPGEDLQGYMEPGETSAVVVGATLRTRVADNDTPFALSFDNPDTLLGAVEDASESGVPLWHLAFLNPKMAQARNLGDDYLLFGAYPRERSEQVEEGIHQMSKNYRGNVLPTAETHRIWTERFFPVAPAHPIPDVERELVDVSQLPELLAEASTNKEPALQCTVARSKKALLLTFETI
jgi:hypothetical protein